MFTNNVKEKPIEDFKHPPSKLAPLVPASKLAPLKPVTAPEPSKQNPLLEPKKNELKSSMELLSTGDEKIASLGSLDDDLPLSPSESPRKQVKVTSEFNDDFVSHDDLREELSDHFSEDFDHSGEVSSKKCLFNILNSMNLVITLPMIQILIT